ncbi:hypothetical protein J437_LFUL019383, partial [Ladona fulva]
MNALMMSPIERIYFRKWFYLSSRDSFCKNTKTAFSVICRHLSHGEVLTALRPFYFSVHPDLFGQHPTERAINENSLKQLNAYIEHLQMKRPTTPANLCFYLRSPRKPECDHYRIRPWLSKYGPEARKNAEALAPIKEEVARL